MAFHRIVRFEGCIENRHTEIGRLNILEHRKREQIITVRVYKVQLSDFEQLSLCTITKTDIAQMTVLQTDCTYKNCKCCCITLAVHI